MPKGPSFAIERGLPRPLAGVDEAGCGPLAGPVVAAAVILDRRRYPRGIDDSKRLSEADRDRLHLALRKTAAIGVGIVSVAEIEEINILNARMVAMARAVEALSVAPAMVLVDGNRAPDLHYDTRTIVKGDAVSRSIAAASIIAKVTRDRIMLDLDRQHPLYGWRRNKGYPTPDHKRALDEFGPSPHHRRGFAPVRAALAKHRPS